MCVYIYIYIYIYPLCDQPSHPSPVSSLFPSICISDTATPSPGRLRQDAASNM